MKKLTKALIKTILPTKVVEVDKEDLQAILKLFGFQVKEYEEIKNEDGSRRQVDFEIHYRRIYIIRLSMSAGSAVGSYENEWENFGDGLSGVAIPTHNIADLMLILLNFWVDKLCPRYDGPQYDERQDYEYKSVEEVQSLLEYLQSQLESFQKKDK